MDARGGAGLRGGPGAPCSALFSHSILRRVDGELVAASLHGPMDARGGADLRGGPGATCSAIRLAADPPTR